MKKCLAIRGNDANNYQLLITLKDGKRVAQFRKFLKGEVVEEKIKEIQNGEIILRISADELEYKFWVQKKKVKRLSWLEQQLLKIFQLKKLKDLLVHILECLHQEMVRRIQILPTLIGLIMKLTLKNHSPGLQIKQRIIY